MSRSRPRLLQTTVFAAGLLSPAIALAAQPATTISEVVITATRLPTVLDVTPGAYVVTEQEIQQRQAVFATDILTTIPSLSVFSNGAFGGVTSVQQRGATSDKTLVLLDGVPLNDASQPEGGFDFSAVDLSDISRVEVLNGPQSSIWGSDAMGGVIAFTTRESKGLRLNVEGGSFATQHVSGSVGRTSDRWALSAAASEFSTNGVSAADHHNNYAAYPGFTASEPDGTHEFTASVRGRLTVSDTLQLDGQVRVNQSATKTDGYPAPLYFVLADTNDVSFSRGLDAYLHAKIDGPLGLKSDVSVDRYAIERNSRGDSGAYGYNATRDVYRFTSGRGGVDDVVSFLVGAERQIARASLSDGSRHDLGTTSGFAVAQWRPVHPLTASVSVRYDSPDSYNGQITSRLGLGYEIGAGFSLAASWSQGFKTPTISEIACDFCSPAGPSLNLKPEHSDGEDFGVSWKSPDRSFSARATYYALNVRDEITFVSNFAVFPATFRYANVSRVRSRGVEVEAEAGLVAGFRVKAAYTHDDSYNLDTNQRQLRVPPDMVSGSLFWNRGPAEAALTIRSESSQSDYSFETAPTDRPGFTVASLAGSYALNPHVTLTARVENLGDAAYQEVSGFGEPGRSLFVGVRFRQ